MMNITLKVERYELKAGTKGIWTLTETEEAHPITEEQHNNIIEAAPFFRNLGGSETLQKSYTSAGNVVTKIISKSPDRTQKTVRTFTITA